MWVLITLAFAFAWSRAQRAADAGRVALVLAWAIASVAAAVAMVADIAGMAP